MKNKIHLLLSFLILAVSGNSFGQYCTPNTGTGCVYGDQINSFSLNGISNISSGCSSLGFGDFTAMSTSLTIFNSYTATVTVGTYGQGVGIWVDWNQDNDFDDAGEFYSNNNVTTANGSELININVPSDALSGATRMRVGCVYNANISSTASCDISSFGYGEIEDYTLIIEAATANVLNFNNASNAVNLPLGLTTSLNGANQFSVEAWINVDNATGFQTIVNNHSGGSTQFNLRINNGTLDGFIGFGAFSTTSAAGLVSANTWHHVAMNFGGGFLRIYLDGVQVGSVATGAYTLPLSSQTYQIGKSGFSEEFYGSIEEVRFWSASRTVTEINNTRFCELVGNETNLIACYHFNQGLDAGNNASVTTAINATALPYNGILNGFALTGTSSNWLKDSPLTPASQSLTYDLNATAIPLTTGNVGTEWYNSVNSTMAVATPTPSTIALGTTAYFFTEVTAGGCKTAKGEFLVSIADSMDATHLNFGATSEYVLIPTAAINNLATGTIETWVYLESLVDQTICLKQNDFVNSYSYLSVGGGLGTVNPGQIYYQSSNTSSFVSNTILVANQWYHLAVTFDNTSANLYIDGVLDITASGNYSVPSDLTPTVVTTLGTASNGGSYFKFLDGNLEEFRVWNIKRPIDEINRTKDCEIDASSTGLVTYYKFNQGADATYNPTITTLTDATTNAFDGTLNNFDLNLASSNWRASSPVSSGVIIPNQPSVVGNTTIYCLNETPSQLTASGSNLMWYTTAIGGTGTTTAPTPSAASAGTTSYYVSSANANGCESERSQIDVTVLNPSASTDVQSSCNSYTWIDGNNYTSSNSSATFTYTSGAANGCDSVVTLNLTINNSPNVVASNPSGIMLTSTAANAYQWIDCATNGAITGANGQNFTPTVNGSYAVIGTSATSCSDTSNCIVISTVGLNELADNIELIIAPNPTSNQVSVSFNLTDAILIVKDANGKIVIDEKTINSGDKISLETMQAGVYFFELKSKEGIVIKRIVKL